MGAAQTQSPARERAIVFSNEEQISHILAEAADLGVQVLIRIPGGDGRAVRGTLESMEQDRVSLHVAGISHQGEQILEALDQAVVEFVLLSKKIVFFSKFRGRAPGKVSLSIPSQVYAIERRSTARVRVPATRPAIVRIPALLAPLERFDSPFLPSHLRGTMGDVPAQMRVDDISLGGVACYTRYTAVAEALRAGNEPVSLTIQFPGSLPLEAPVTIRWVKKTTRPLDPAVAQEVWSLLGGKSPLPQEKVAVIKESFTRVGIQFLEVSQELDTRLRYFIRELQLLGSV